MKGKQWISVSFECESTERKGIGHHCSLEWLVVVHGAHRTQEGLHRGNRVSISGVKTQSAVASGSTRAVTGHGGTGWDGFKEAAVPPVFCPSLGFNKRDGIYQ